MDRKVSTANLKVGMYVSKLDRPWMQTPFLIQGFFIEDKEQISKLVEYCEYVFIDIEMGEKADVYLDTLPSVSVPGFQVKQRLSSNRQVETILTTGKKSVAYTDKKSTIEELPQARAAIEKASSSIAHMMENDIRHGKLDYVKAKAVVEPILDSIIRNSDAFMWLSKMQDHDSYSYDHSVQNCALGIAFGRHIGLKKNDLSTLAIGLLLMDVGKIKLPKALLTKNTPLTQDETTIMRKHVAFTVEILRKAKGINEHIINIALTHHERYDGSGYPNGLVGTQTPAFGRMAAIIDCYDSMISSTPYKQPISEHKALQNIYNLSDKLFQKDLVEQFIQCMGVYPTGSLVELTSGAVGAVLSQNTEQKMKPRILMLLDEKKRPLKKHQVFDMEKPGKTPLFIAKSLDNNTYGVDIKQVRL
jgi:HD-GYP domain-containing protein (c-di-GMP phosphodiesterase class II)